MGGCEDSRDGTRVLALHITHVHGAEVGSLAQRSDGSDPSGRPCGGLGEWREHDRPPHRRRSDSLDEITDSLECG